MVQSADRREHGQAIVSAVDHMVQRIFVLHTKTAGNARYQSKTGRSRQTHEYPIQGTTAEDSYDLAFDAFQSMASNAPCTGLTPSDRPRRSAESVNVSRHSAL
jgi:hypothetical protein